MIKTVRTNEQAICTILHKDSDREYTVFKTTAGYLIEGKYHGGLYPSRYEVLHVICPDHGYEYDLTLIFASDTPVEEVEAWGREYKNLRIRRITLEDDSCSIFIDHNCREKKISISGVKGKRLIPGKSCTLKEFFTLLEITEEECQEVFQDAGTN